MEKLKTTEGVYASKEGWVTDPPPINPGSCVVTPTRCGSGRECVFGEEKGHKKERS